MVPMPAAISSTWRSALASISPLCRFGIRSDIAMYNRLAADIASTYGRMLGITCTAPNATSAPARLAPPVTTFSSSARPRL